MQFVLVARFDAGLATLRGARVARGLDLLEIFGGQRPDVSDGVRDGLTVRVVANEPRFEIDARKTGPLDREVGDFPIRQPRVQRDRFEPRAAAARFANPRDFLRVDQAGIGEPRQRAIQIVDLLGNEFELVGREVLREHTAAPIEDQAANRRHRLDTNAIALRTLREVFVVDHLQLNEPCHDDPEQQNANKRRQQDPGDEEPAFGVVILDG